MTVKVERLVNLTIALLEARRPLTLAELRDKTGYYSQDDAESARRMFERDKDDLRRLGVPVETAPTDPFGAELGYRIDRRDYELPDIDLTAEEVAALALALQMTSDDVSRLAMTKVAARAPDPAALEVPVPARLEIGSHGMEAFADPVVEQQVVRFRYRTAAGQEAQRTVDPYAIVLRRGAWYLLGRDHDRDDLRAFRGDRVIGRVTLVGEPGAFSPPDDLDAAAAVGHVEEEREALIAVAPGLDWEAEVRGGHPTGDTTDDGWSVYRFERVGQWRLVTWVLGLGASAEVLAPEDLRADVRRRLERIVEVCS